MTPRQLFPHTVTGSSVSSTAGIPTPIAIPTQPQQSGLARLYEATPEVVMPEPLKRSEHPGPKFWEKRPWKDWVDGEVERGGFNPGKEGQGANSSFLEDEDGNRVHVDRQKEILGEATTSWNTMKDFNIKLTAYRDMPATSLDYFRARMESKCPELRLCANHWKVDEIWTEKFSSWRNRSSNTPEVKLEVKPPMRQRRL